MMMVSDAGETKRIESKLEVDTYIERLRYAIRSGNAYIQFQERRRVDEGRDVRYSNGFTVHDLFPDEDVVAALKRELVLLTSDEYIETLKDLKHNNRADLRVFGRCYTADVYIKLRVELMKSSSAGVENAIFVMSFHYAEHPFCSDMFPHKKDR